MNALILSTMLAVSAPLFAAVEAPAAGQDAGCEQAVLVKVVSGERDEPTADVQLFTVGGDGVVQASGAGCATAKLVMLESNTEEGDGEKQIRIVTRMTQAVDEDRGWLGVALGDMTAAMGRDNNLENGVVVMNVVKDSPADNAGLEENDIITHLNGEKIAGGVAGLAKEIGELGPGGLANLTIVRGGQTMNLSATLGTPQAEFEWIHSPDLQFKDYTRLHPWAMKLCPKGGAHQLRLEDLAELDDPLSAVAKALDSMGATVRISIADGTKNLEVETTRNGTVIKVAQEDDGPISVTRYTEGEDDVIETEYATAEALEAGDPEAFEIYNGIRSHAVFVRPGDATFSFDFDVDPGNWLTDDIHKRLEMQLRDAGVQMENAQKALDEAMARIPNIQFGGEAAARAKFFLGTDKVTQSFKVNPEGQIELTLRKGDTEVVKVYRDEADLEARDPEAYERYEDIMQAPLDE